MKLASSFSVLVALCGMEIWNSVAAAHHSFAMFDRHNELVLHGTVQQFQWENPHTYIQLISDKDHENWTIELRSLNGLLMMGWHSNSLRPGDKITAHIHPLRNGALGGELMYVVTPGGKELHGSPQGENGGLYNYEGAKKH
jgi:hypothetical protein